MMEYSPTPKEVEEQHYKELVQRIRRLKGLQPIPNIMLPAENLRPFIEAMEADLDEYEKRP